jgi:hypothetical protein
MESPRQARLESESEVARKAGIAFVARLQQIFNTRVGAIAAVW